MGEGKDSFGWALNVGEDSPGEATPATLSLLLRRKEGLEELLKTNRNFVLILYKFKSSQNRNRRIGVSTVVKLQICLYLI